MSPALLPVDEQRCRNKRFVIEFVEAVFNQRDLAALDRHTTADFLEHDGLGGRAVSRNAGKLRMAALHRTFPDLWVEVLDALAEGDQVVLRNVWRATAPQTGYALEFHGFTWWRIRDGKIAEHWASVTPLHEKAMGTPDW